MSKGFTASDFYNPEIVTGSAQTKNSYGPPVVPYRGTEESILNQKVVDGHIYYAYDTGKIFIDKDSTRVTMGSAGSAIYFGRAEDLKPIDGTEEDAEEKIFHFPKEALENQKDAPKPNDIILNLDGAFYRIQSIESDYFVCLLLSVSGTGGNNSQISIVRPSLYINTTRSVASNIINGSDAKIYFTATSAKDENDMPLTDKLTISWSLHKIIQQSPKITEQYASDILTVDSGVEDYIDLTQHLLPSTSSEVKIVASGDNHDMVSPSRSREILTTNLSLSYLSSFNPATTYDIGEVVLSYNVEGNTEKIIECWVDNEDQPVDVQYISKSNVKEEFSFTVPARLGTHGYHKIRIDLYKNDGSATNPRKGQQANSLEHEIAVVDKGNPEAPVVIWIGDYKSIYYQYDAIQIPFLVYDPKNTASATVYFYKDVVLLDEDGFTIKDFSKYSYWEIADAEMDKMNYYRIVAGDTDATRCEREISFEVQKDPDRKNMVLVKDKNLKLVFDPAGRSNNESSTKRTMWESNKNGVVVKGKFEGFNWHNNGWIMDPETRTTCLRISNGAKFSIPFGNLVFGSTQSGQQSNTIAVQFKIRNIQNYKNLITNITRYVGDDDYYAAFIAPDQKTYTNYDAFLQWYLRDNVEVYENLKFLRVQKNIDLTNTVLSFFSGTVPSITGICVGPQDTFFSNGTNTLSVSFVENEIITLSFVYDHTLKLLLIYVNGIISGVIKSSGTSSLFTIAANELVFNSDNCDIDLYKLRIYNEVLSVNDILINYAVDRKDICVYDQRTIAESNDNLAEFQIKYQKMLDYNSAHPDDMLMPYIVFDTSKYSDNRLPWAKSMETRDIEVNFVNTILDRAVTTGLVEKLAKEDGLIAEDEMDPEKIKEGIRTYYKHHCPSWTSTMSSGDVVTIEVQGTSSEFYPRRNFKVKTKFKKENTWGNLKDDNGNITGEGWTEKDCLNIFMNRGPYADIFAADQAKLKADPHYYGKEKSRLNDGWYMNNYTNPTDRWTMKVDYMESSGSYNAGFASLVGTAYTKHPLQYYLESGAFSNTECLENDITGDVNWKDFRTSLLGFPVMAFQKKYDGSYLFIGLYRMLLDKGSDEVLGFKTPKALTHNFIKDDKGKNKKVRDVAECWEFATNSRTFCSFRDPWNRVQLSFKSPAGKANEFTSTLAPVVMNHFEYRYHWAEDFIDGDDYGGGLFNYSKMTQGQLDKLIADVKDASGWDVPNYSACGSIADSGATEEQKQNARDVSDLTLKFYENYEKVCAWLWSTNLDNVASQGSYNPIELGNVLFESNKYFKLVYNNGQNEYVKAETFDPDYDGLYYTFTTVIDDAGKEKEDYVPVYVVNNEAFRYKPNAFYIKVDDTTYALATDPSFDNSTEYYQFVSKSDAELALIADPLVKPATEYIPGTTYYTYDGSVEVKPGQPTGAVKVATVDSEATFNAGNYYIADEKEYVGKKYKYDTKEYRAAKFTNELTDHFDPEYVATYFIMTEVFECYDSRGKNCMLASWGPKEEGGDYIWYPIFYDIDTQLGINNTGIPSFEFNVDATEAGNYSTSDSILWNNFYKFFKNSYILTKYQNLRGLGSSWDQLEQPPLQSIDHIEGWYNFDYEVTKNLATNGTKPMIATNLDEYFKYITITNENAILEGVAYLEGNDGVWSVDDGTYFYALQGDRSQSRRQFLTSRIEYIDSWLGQNNYARGGGNRIRGRISANNSNISDKWVETTTDRYWENDIEFGVKNHEFDAEYWLTLTPIRSGYVTAGDDSANYPPQKFDGANPVKYKMAELETGIKSSANYPEQLIYIYGMNQMSDFGDLNNLYFTEFFMEGDASHLTRLQLGYDGKDKDENTWYNTKLNGIKLAPMPLLQEANFSNITLSSEETLDLKSSEKLEVFRATGMSKLVEAQFADGVALHTLYLPASVRVLSLTQANALTKLLKTFTAPEDDPETGKLTAEPGLFIEGIFPKYESELSAINIDGGSLGYGSYELLTAFYNAKKTTTGSRISLQDVNWSPYVLCVEGDVDDGESDYYLDDGHYGFVPYDRDTNTTVDFNNYILNGQLYRYTKQPDIVISDDFVNILRALKQPNNGFHDFSGQNRPIISGIVYIQNTTALEESVEIAQELQTAYPNLKMFFGKVNKAYSAEFLQKNPTTGAFEHVPMADGSKIASVQKISKFDYADNNNIWFSNPFGNLVYNDKGEVINPGVTPTGLYNPKKTHYDFRGWSTDPTSLEPGGTDPTGAKIITTPAQWAEMRITSSQEEYKFYAIFAITSYDVTFHDGDGTVLVVQRYPYDTEGIDTPADKVPWKDDSNLSPVYMTYGLEGWAEKENSTKLVDLSTYRVRNNGHLYPVFKEKTVYDNINTSYFEGNLSAGKVQLTLVKKVRGKITIPDTWELNNQIYPVGSINGSFASGAVSGNNYIPMG